MITHTYTHQAGATTIMQDDDGNNQKEEEEEEEPPFMPSRRGRTDSHHDGEGATATPPAAAAAAATGGGWDSDSNDNGMGGAFAAMERQTEALIQMELDKAEESLYVDRPPPMAVADQQLTAAATTAAADDAEAQFWIAYRAQQEEAERKAKEKERNFALEWSSAFVHLRVQGHAIPRPPSGGKEKEEEEEEEENLMAQSPVSQCRGVTWQAKKEGDGWAWFPPLPSASVSLSGASRGYFGSGSLEHVEVKGQASKMWRRKEEDDGEEEEVFARHGSGGEIEILGYDRRPPGIQPGPRRQRDTGDHAADENEEARQAADPAHVSKQARMSRYVDAVWQEMLTLLEAPLARMKQLQGQDKEACKKTPQKRKLST